MATPLNSERISSPRLPLRQMSCCCTFQGVPSTKTTICRRLDTLVPKAAPEVTLARPLFRAAASFVCQTLQSILQKARGPLVDKATTDPDGVSNMGDQDPIGQE